MSPRDLSPPRPPSRPASRPPALPRPPTRTWALTTTRLGAGGQEPLGRRARLGRRPGDLPRRGPAGPARGAGTWRRLPGSSRGRAPVARTWRAAGEGHEEAMVRVGPDARGPDAANPGPHRLRPRRGSAGSARMRPSPTRSRRPGRWRSVGGRHPSHGGHAHEPGRSGERRSSRPAPPPRGFGRTSRTDAWAVASDRDRGRPRRVRPLRPVLGLRLGSRLRGALRGGRLPLAVLLAAARGRDPAGVAVAGDPRPVDPARVPDDLLRVPAGLLPVVLRRSAGLRGRGAAGPSALRDGGALPVHPPEPPSDLPLPRSSSRCPSCGSTRSWPSTRTALGGWAWAT